MKFLLDTNICIFIINQKPIEVIQTWRTYEIGDLGISSITIAELEYGVEKSSRRDQNRFALAQFLAPFELVPFDDRAARIYGEIRAKLERQGKVIGPLDMQIAAHALAENCTLVTNNTAEFSRIDGLQLVDWVK